MPSSAQFIIPPEDFILVSSGAPASNITLPSRCRGLLVGVGGALNITMSNGSDRDGVPFTVGITPGFFSTIRITAGGAQNIWAIV